MKNQKNTLRFKKEGDYYRVYMQEKTHPLAYKFYPLKFLKTGELKGGLVKCPENLSWDSFISYGYVVGDEETRITDSSLLLASPSGNYKESRDNIVNCIIKNSTIEVYTTIKALKYSQIENTTIEAHTININSSEIIGDNQIIIGNSTMYDKETWFRFSKCKIAGNGVIKALMNTRLMADNLNISGSFQVLLGNYGISFKDSSFTGDNVVTVNKEFVDNVLINDQGYVGI